MPHSGTIAEKDLLHNADFPLPNNRDPGGRLQVPSYPPSPGSVGGSGGAGTETARGRSLKLGVLKQHHPEWCGDHWADLEAFYRGGRALKSRILADHDGRILTRRVNEGDKAWRERVRRLIHTNHLADIVDRYVALVFGTRPELRTKDEQEPDAWYTETFFKNCDRRRTDLVEFMRDRVLWALLLQRSYALVERPKAVQAPTSLAEQEAGGLLDTWLVPIAAREIIDWGEDDAGALSWAIRYGCQVTRDGLGSVRGSRLVFTWTYYDRDMFRRFELALTDPERIKQAMNGKLEDDTTVPEVESGPHATPGRLPLLRYQFRDGLWLGDRMFDVSAGYLNVMSARVWNLTTALIPQLVLNSSTPGENGPLRVAPGEYFDLGTEDKLAYLEPPTASAVVAGTVAEGLKDETYRVGGQVHQSVTDASTTEAPAEGKRRDMMAMMTMAKDVGQSTREWLDETLETVSAARADGTEWGVQGFDQFNKDDEAALVDQAVKLGSLIPSQTFNAKLLTKLAHTLLDGLTPDEKATIAREIEEGVDEMAKSKAAAAAALQEATDEDAKGAFRGNGAKGEDEEKGKAKPPGLRPVPPQAG